MSKEAINLTSKKIGTDSSLPNPEERARSKAKAAAQLRRSVSCLVPIKPQGSKQPFFCVHPLAGVVFPYYELAFLLGEEQPFYGLQSVGMAGKIQSLTSIEEMAACYIKAMQTIQPQGPYSLGGWSFGAIVAFEMAQQLQRDNQSVALLVSLDTTATSASRFLNSWEMVKFFLGSTVLHIWPYVVEYLNLHFFPNSKKETMEHNSEGKQPKLEI